MRAPRTANGGCASRTSTSPRARPGAGDTILATLERLGFEWDGPVWRQSERAPCYENALAQLRAQGMLYACACTRAQRAHDPIGRLGERIYPGVCRGGIDAARAARQAPGIPCTRSDGAGRVHRSAPWLSAAVASTRTSAISSFAAATDCSRISWPSSSTMRRKALPTSYAARICSRRRRARSSCSRHSVCRRRVICMCRSQSTRAAASCRSRPARTRFERSSPR